MTTEKSQALVDAEDIVASANRTTSYLNDLATYLENWLNKTRDDLTVKTPDIAIAFFAIKEAHEALDAATKRFYHVKDALDKHVLPVRLEADGNDLIRVPSIARSFSIRPMTSASMIDKEKGMEWLRSIGQGDIIQPTVNAGTLASFCRNMILEEGIEPPEDIIKITTWKAISVTKYTPKPGAV